MSAEASTPKLSRRLVLERYPIDGQAVKKLVLAGMTWLKTNQPIVNALNVFPVPDGDTGTNMTLTMQSALDEIDDSPEAHAGKMLAKVAQGALMGARGNSGVILSQLWRGVAQAAEKDGQLTAKGLAKAFGQARDTAYKGVVKPVEGTILTVAKDIAIATEEAAKNTDSAYDILEVACKAAAESVERTPELLPILKEAGVVDSGGKGLFFLLEGMVRWVNGDPLDTPITEVHTLTSMGFEHTMEEVEEGQDYEVVVDFLPKGPLDLNTFYSGLEELGTSIQVGEGDGMYRMHIHTELDKRFLPIEYCEGYGTITKIAMENLMAQMEEIERQAAQSYEVTPVKTGEIGVVAVAPGPGLARVFASLGVAAIVEGGQTMNPSIQDILASFENLPTNDIIILPNNKNIIMCSNSAAELSVKNVRVIESRNVPQGFAAMLRLMPTGKLDQVVEDMITAISEVETGEITTATRDVELDGVTIKQGQVIGLHNNKIVIANPEIGPACFDLLDKMVSEEHELITMYYGDTINQDQAEEMAAALEERYAGVEVEIQNGGQPHYHYIFSVE